MNNMDYKQVIASAITNEVEAYEFYSSAAQKSNNATLRSLFEELAAEESKHKVLLEAFLNNDSIKMNFQGSADYKVSETVALPKLSTDMSFKDGIALAMKKEEEAMRMYQDFAAQCSDEDQKRMFLQLATMEQGHKTKLEEVYTNTAFVEVW